MALHALQGGVCARQRERRRAVVKGRGGPVRGRVTDRAIRREAGGNVIRIGGSCEVRLVAAIASRRQVTVVVAGVALDATQRRVRARQSIVGIHRVIESDRGRPVDRVMARVASRREARGRVIGIRGSRPVCLMAAEASRRQACVIVIRMALRASQRGVCAGQREHRRMIERGWIPCRCVMA